jgi:transposase
MNRRPYPSDISDDEWAFVSPYLTLMAEEAPQRVHGLREVFNRLRWIVRAGACVIFSPRRRVPPRSVTGRGRLLAFTVLAYKYGQALCQRVRCGQSMTSRKQDRPQKAAHGEGAAAQGCTLGSRSAGVTKAKS